MKTLIGLIFLSLNQMAFACPDFSGDYVKNIMATDLSIVQEGCEKMEYIFESGSTVYALDGQERLVNKFDIEVGEGRIATVEIYQSKEFSGDKLITHGKSVTHYEEGNDNDEIIQVWSETILDENKNMVATTHYEDGSTEETIYYRLE